MYKRTNRFQQTIRPVSPASPHRWTKAQTRPVEVATVMWGTPKRNHDARPPPPVLLPPQRLPPPYAIPPKKPPRVVRSLTPLAIEKRPAPQPKRPPPAPKQPVVMREQPPMQLPMPRSIAGCLQQMAALRVWATGRLEWTDGELTIWERRMAALKARLKPV
jgi:hypothetical protein